METNNLHIFDGIHTSDSVGGTMVYVFIYGEFRLAARIKKKKHLSIHICVLFG